jgi:hypothetical protein
MMFEFAKFRWGQTHLRQYFLWALAEIRDRLGELLRLHYRYRFDPEGVSQADREALHRDATECLARMG